MGVSNELSAKEQKVLTMCIVEGCLEFAKESGKSIEAVLNEDLFPVNCTQAFTDTVCYNIKLLVDEGYLSGEVELGYNDFEPGEDASKGISTEMSFFDNITITEKGKTFLKAVEFGVKAEEFKAKAIPVLKQIGNVALEAVVETLVVSVLHTVGI